MEIILHVALQENIMKKLGQYQADDIIHEDSAPQKMKFWIKDLFSKSYENLRKLLTSSYIY